MVSQEQMSAASWEVLGKIDIIQKPMPVLKPGELLIRVAASGICGTDMHICNGETPHATRHATVGHEFSGFVEAIHDETTTSASIGDLVAVDPNNPCHQCGFCRSKKYHLCGGLKCIGVTCDGGMAKYVAAPSAAVYVIPEGVTPEVASLAEPLSCVVHAVDTGSIKTGDRVLVVGAGPIGLMVTALCSTGGAHVTVTDINEMRLQRATEFGASVISLDVDIGGDPTLGFGFDVVYECVGRPETMLNAINCAKAGGTVVWVGVAKPGVTVPVSPFDIYRRELTIKSTYTNPYGMERAVKILSDKKVDWSKLITHTFPLEQFDAAWEVFKSGAGLKVCIKPNSD
ncbi:hypothetical protein IW140_002728 [Coemansia sp. RSA 1813]|nr:hypothetical protein EV178_003609 [Coemansia sp. RSA 1646]KAJ1769082.1 hypothetical protein LPJ74_004316 [Coemansia sp. RSA 1843]KAJ2088408.1 hypothetical protein IW138_004284 [Coemansia sp. RSA 986]KAJ2213845.1 hypothetical protein EV179_003544 [Coemansia sp. RSA 487]KAJ2569840.1 hypothetical protein IW140_002728 [Coemansia sp. RSA 1813]